MTISHDESHSVEPVSQRLRAAAAAMQGETVPVSALVEAQGTAALGAILVLVSVPAILPSTGIPFASLFTPVMALIGLSMLLGKDEISLPAKIANMQIGRSLAVAVLEKMATLFSWTERWLKPRMTHLTNGTAYRLLAINVLLMAFIIFLPIPFGNTIPAFALIAMGLGMIERDGFAVIASLAIGVVGVGIALAFGWASLALLSQVGDWATSAYHSVMAR
jgi:hypothetical protein